MSSTKQDLVNKRFGRLLVVNKTDKKSSSRHYYWRCICDCGNEIKVIGVSLTSGNTTSCGCYRSEKAFQNFDNASIENIVENTRLDNLTKKLNKNNTSGVKGVGFNKKANKYHAYIGFQKKIIFLGYYDTLDEAKKTRIRAEENYFVPVLDKYGKDFDLTENGLRKQ